MSTSQGWFESDDEYRDRVAKEANELIVKSGTGNSPSQGWLESDHDYHDRITKEASETIVKTSTGSSPSQGWFEGEDEYRSRVIKEASEAIVKEASGSSPSQGVFESDYEYRSRVSKEADEQILRKNSGSTPSQGMFEGDLDYRKRVAKESNERILMSQQSSTRSERSSAGGGSSRSTSMGGAKSTGSSQNSITKNLLLALGVLLTVIVVVSTLTPTSKPAPTPSVQPTPQAQATARPTYVESTIRRNEYHGTYSIAVASAYARPTETEVELLISNLDNRRTVALFGSGQSDVTHGDVRSERVPFLSDSQGNEYLAKLPVIRGPAAERLVLDGTYGGVTMNKVALPPSGSLKARLVFPPLPHGVTVQLHVPGVGLITPPFSPDHHNSDATPILNGNGEVRRANEVANISVRRALVAASLATDGEPIGEASVFQADEPYGNDRRQHVYYYVEYSGAIPEKTDFTVQLEFNGQPVPAYMTNCRMPRPVSREGSVSCRTSGYFLASGDWHVALAAGGQELNRIGFKIVPR